MKELYKALSAFQQEVPNIYKNAKGYNYKFADLGEINEIIKPLLKTHGLGYVQPIDGDSIRTIVFHVESGESIEGSANIPQGVKLNGMNDFQVLGSAITYLRRYSLSSMLGLITDEDADAAGEQVTKETPSVDVVGVLKRAKGTINEELEKQGYTTAVAKKAFILKVLEHSTIDSLDEAELVMQQLENEAQ